MKKVEDRILALEEDVLRLKTALHFKGEKIYSPSHEMYKYFKEYLDSIGIKSDQLEYDDPSRCKIFFSSIPPKINPAPHIWLINVEQATRPNILALNNMRDCHNVYDYSEENIEVLRKIKPKCNFVHIPYGSVSVREEIYNYEKLHGIAMVGNNCTRRTQIENRIGNVTNILGWGNERDDKLFRYKILVNVHFSPEYNITEQIRINRCIYNKMIVISENSIHQDKLKLKDKMLFASYDEIPELANKVLDNYEYYYNKLLS